MIVLKNFLADADVRLVAEYAQESHFHTKENHPPLHDPLYSQDSINFDIRTRGEFSEDVLQIFSKYSRKFYEFISSLHPNEEYLPAMFSKHYIARYRDNAFEPPQTDTSKPDGTYVSYIFWNNNFSGGEIVSVNAKTGQEKVLDISPGDLVIFEEGNLEEMRSIRPVTAGKMYLSQAWMGKKGQAWFSNVDYAKTNWDSWEIRGF